MIIQSTIIQLTILYNKLKSAALNLIKFVNFKICFYFLDITTYFLIGRLDKIKCGLNEKNVCRYLPNPFSVTSLTYIKSIFFHNCQYLDRTFDYVTKNNKLRWRRQVFTGTAATWRDKHRESILYYYQQTINLTNIYLNYQHLLELLKMHNFLTHFQQTHSIFIKCQW